MKPIQILLIEDNEGDILLTKEALEESKIINEVRVIRDGAAAIAFFEQLIKQEDVPDLVLLDVNLPMRNGHEVLQFIKGSERHRHIPVIMLTTSSAEKDVMRAYDNYVNCYISKPIEVVDFMTAMMKIEDFWINIVTLYKR